MNLKRLRGIMAAALAGLTVALLAGCMNSMAGSTDGNARGVATLHLSATGIPNDYAEQFAEKYPNAGARSITPNNPYTPESDGLTFYLSGTSETGKNLGDIAVELQPVAGSVDASGKPIEWEFKGNVVIDSMSWNLVLTAYTDGAAKAKPVLQGFCSVDLRNGSGSAMFKLSPENLTTSGSVNITGKFKPNDNVASYTIGIYKKDSASEKVDETFVNYTGNGTADEEFTYTCASIKPGSYLYKMIFKNAVGTITGSFIDTLIVDAGNPLVRDLGILDVVNKKPGAPTGFTASLETGSESADGTYRVKLGWTSGGGETNFEVELTEYIDDGTTTATGYPKIYGMASMDMVDPKDGVINFQGSDVWSGKGGAMTYGDKEAYLKLKLGVVYEVRIRARNYVGISKDDAVTDGWTKRSAGTDEAGFVAYGTEKINRMKIEYNLNGGTLNYYNGSAYDPPKTTNFTEYKTWKGTNLDLLEIDNDNTTTGNNLNKGMSPFAEWRTDVKDPDTKVEKSDYKNLSVTAFYGSSVNTSVGMAGEKQDVDEKDITVRYNDTTMNGVTPYTTYIVPKAVNGVVTQLIIQLSTTDAEKVYNNIQFELTYNGTQTYLPYDTGTSNQCVLSLDEYVAGKIQVRVIADTKNAIGMSQTLTFDLY